MRLTVALLCVLAVGCSDDPEPVQSPPDVPAIQAGTKEHEAAESACRAIDIVAGRSRVTASNIEARSVRMTQRPAGHGLDKDYLVEGETFARGRNISWWAVVRHHKDERWTNEGWGFGPPPKTQADIDYHVSNTNKPFARFPD